MYYYYHRWYDASIGRFISPDPKPCPLSECQKLNRYVYVSNRPTVLTDPDGEGNLMCQTLDGVVSPCGVLRDSLGNLPLGTRIVAGTQSISSATSSEATTLDSSGTVTAPTGVLRDNSGTLPAGTTITITHTPTDSVTMGTTTVANANRQISENRRILGTTAPIDYTQLDARNAYNRCVNNARSFVGAGLLVVVSGSSISLIGLGVASFFPPAEVIVPFLEAGALIVGTGFVLTGAVYYGVNCHPPE